MLSAYNVFTDAKGIICIGYFEKVKTINGECYTLTCFNKLARSFFVILSENKQFILLISLKK